MDKNRIITDIKKKKTFTPQFLLNDGGLVVDTAVDELNRLNYIIKRGKDFSIELAENTQPAERFLTSHKKIVIVTNGVIESVTEEN